MIRATKAITMAWRRPILLAVALALSIFVYYAVDFEMLPVHINQRTWGLDSRVQVWDFQDTQEEIFCRRAHNPLPSKKPIPNVVHFVLPDDGRPFDLSYAKFLALKAAVLRMGADEVKLHAFALNQQNQWWKQLQNHVTFVPIRPDEFQGPNGLAMEQLQIYHQADIIRMGIMNREGGIYLDTDAYTLKPFTDLLNNPRDTVLGHEGGNRFGLCNAVIITRPYSAFMAKWLDSYNTFSLSEWNQHSVKKPKQLQLQYPDLVCPLSPSVFFWPTWAERHVSYMYDPITAEEANEIKANLTSFGGSMYANQLAYHATGPHDILGNLTLERILEEDTRFNILIRDIATAPL